MNKTEVSGSAIIKDGKLLLIWKRKRGHYEFPGGKVRPGETLEQTAKREAREEIGCEVELIKYLGYDDISIDSRNFRGHKFLAKIKPGQKPRVNEPEISRDLIWLPIKDYQKYSLAPNVKTTCEDYLKDKLNI